MKRIQIGIIKRGENMENKSDWLAKRRNGITGTDVSKIMGASKWGNALNVFYDKLGLPDPIPDNPNMKWGRLLEPVIINEYNELNNVYSASVGHLIHHNNDWIIGNPDAIVFNDSGAWLKGLEIKTGSNKTYWSKMGDKNVVIPIDYLWQVRWYMLLTDLDEWDIAVLLQGVDYRQYTVYRDSAIEKEMMEVCRDFWFNCVLKKIKPIY